MTDLEDRFVAECRRQGFQPDQNAMQKAAIALAGSKQTPEGLIHLCNVGVISPADFARSLRNGMPEAFAALADDKPAKSTGHHSGLTKQYTDEIAANRNKSRLDASKFTGMTRRFIEENQGKHQ
ncbi:hypothetical protein [Bradyrhizobium roseum]|uniref:hypothetical protein n=1 Tax=Bradyrhizobium roseum TaxID=3056648 RepID=UPI0026200201|nr:hypothetical protein [Bradyrhizobium roseus]WKA29337.1 hypothetical protein QUH67_03860 [Bradyrhizobium roseus]